MPENEPAGTVVGSFSTTDANPDDAFSYSLAPGAGDDHNSQFAIVGGQLTTNAPFDFESQQSYSIRVRSIDPEGLWTEENFTISITDVDDQRLVGDRVWWDANGNGLQEPGETGVEGAVVEIYRSANATVGDGDDILQGRAVSDANGDYQLSDLTSQINYFLQVRTPVGYSFTTQHAGDEQQDSEADASGRMPYLHSPQAKTT